MMDDAIAVTSTDNAERRVLALTDPDGRGVRSTVTTINMIIISTIAAAIILHEAKSATKAGAHITCISSTLCKMASWKRVK